jgi:hypothetical protein
MDRSPRAVIAQVLADGVTPLLTGHGFTRRGRVAYGRVRDSRWELVTVEPRHGGRYGGLFTISLGVFVPEVDAVVSLYPLQAPPQDEDCHVRWRLGGGGMRWEFDAATDLAALEAEVRQGVELNALSFFDEVGTGPGILAWLREVPVSVMPWPHPVALAAYAGDPALAQQWLDDVIADPRSISDWYRNWLHRQAAFLAGRLGLACPAPADMPVLTAVFRMAAESTPRDRHVAFHDLEFKYRQYVTHFRTLLPAREADQLYHTTECTSDTCTIAFYGADDENMLARLRQSFERLSEKFAGITLIG